MGKRKKVQKDKQRSTNIYIFVSCFLVFSIVNSRTIFHDTQRGGGAGHVTSSQNESGLSKYLMVHE
jgi:hypothetical protein